MVHIAEHHDETSKDFPMEEEPHLLRHRVLAARRLVLQPCAPRGNTRQRGRPGLHQGLLP
jgi:hypothetical protein